MKRAYLVHVPEFVLVTDVDDQDFFRRDLEMEAATAAGEHVRTQLLSQEEMRRRGDEYPVGWWDPDREMTCAEIAADMPRIALLELARRLGVYAGRLLELVA